MKNLPRKYGVVVGDIIHGFEIFGPFRNEMEASDFNTQAYDGICTLIPFIDPEEERDEE